MKIITAPDPKLEKESSPVKLDKKRQQFIKELKQKIKINDDLGLAAPQVGKNWRIFAVNLPNQPVQVYLNPKITSHSPTQKRFKIAELNHQDKKDQPFLEGCLSVPEIYGAVQRWPEISASWQDEKGEKKSATLTNLAAIVFQHELDHLNGILFTQRLLKQGGQVYQTKNGRLQEISLT